MAHRKRNTETESPCSEIESYLFHSKDSPCIYIIAAKAFLFFTDASTGGEGENQRAYGSQPTSQPTSQPKQMGRRK